MVTVAVDPGVHGRGADDTATVTITSEDLPTVTVVATDAAAGEAANPGIFTVTRTGPPTAALTVSYTVGGTATSVTDYTPALSGTAVIPIGAASLALTLTPVNDTAFEGPETVVVTVTGAAPYLVGAASTATVTIADNDLPAVTIAATDASAAEVGPDGGAVTLTRTGILTSPLVVKLTLTGTATNGTDYTLVGPTVTILAGQATLVVPVTPVNDPDAEANETAVVTVAVDPAYTVGAPTNATVTIASEDPADGDGGGDGRGGGGDGESRGLHGDADGADDGGVDGELHGRGHGDERDGLHAGAERDRGDPGGRGVGGADADAGE